MLKYVSLAAFALAVPAFAQDADTVVATVNGETITLGQMVAMKQGLHQQAQGLPDTALWDLMLDQMIRQTVAAQKGAEQMTARDKAALEIDRRAYLAGAAMERVAGTEPDDEALKAVYNKIFGGEPKTEYHAAHILVDSEEKAKEIKAELDGGADFPTLAETRSSGPSGPNKGDLGWFTADQMVPEFSAAVVALKKGEISGPVETSFGWHIIKLEDTRNMTPPKFEEIRDQLVQQWRRDKVESTIAELVTAAKIEKVEGLDVNLLNDTALLDK